MEFAARLATVDLTLMKMLSCPNNAILALCEQLCIKTSLAVRIHKAERRYRLFSHKSRFNPASSKAQYQISLPERIWYSFQSYTVSSVPIVSVITFSRCRQLGFFTGSV